jgi:hypothetical protein
MVQYTKVTRGEGQRSDRTAPWTHLRVLSSAPVRIASEF